MMKASEENRGEVSLPSVFVAAHELKAPLVLMRQLALELASFDAEQQITVERLRLTIERSLRLVDQLTKTRRLEDTLFESEPLLARTVCEAVVTELEPYAKAAQQHLVTRISRRSSVAVGHRSLLTALLVNLCDNAITHNPQGSRVVVSAMAKSDGVVFSVRDQGPRMSHSAFRAIRHQLGRGPLSMNNHPRSSGLGLWIASQFAGAMDGVLTMRRHHAGGITVSVLLPHSKQLSLL